MTGWHAYRITLYIHSSHTVHPKDIKTKTCESLIQFIFHKRLMILTDFVCIFQFMTKMNAVVTLVRMEVLVTMERTGTRAPAYLDSLEWTVRVSGTLHPQNQEGMQRSGRGGAEKHEIYFGAFGGHLFTNRKRSCRKVMFSQAFVCSQGDTAFPQCHAAGRPPSIDSSPPLIYRQTSLYRQTPSVGEH